MWLQTAPVVPHLCPAVLLSIVFTDVRHGVRLIRLIANGALENEETFLLKTLVFIFNTLNTNKIRRRFGSLIGPSSGTCSRSLNFKCLPSVSDLCFSQHLGEGGRGDGACFSLELNGSPAPSTSPTGRAGEERSPTSGSFWDCSYYNRTGKSNKHCNYVHTHTRMNAISIIMYIFPSQVQSR